MCRRWMMMVWNEHCKSQISESDFLLYDYLAICALSSFTCIPEHERNSKFF